MADKPNIGRKSWDEIQFICWLEVGTLVNILLLNFVHNFILNVNPLKKFYSLFGNSAGTKIFPLILSVRLFRARSALCGVRQQ